MNTSNTLHKTLDTLRHFQSLDENLNIIILCAAALSLENKETLAVLDLGEDDIHKYIKDFCHKNTITNIDSINKNIKLLDVFANLKEIYSQNNEDSKKMAEILMSFYVETMNAQRWILAATENPSSAELIAQLTNQWARESLFDGAAGIGYLASLVNAKKNFLCDIKESFRDTATLLFKMMGKEIEYVSEDTILNSETSNNVDLVVTNPPYGVRLSYKEKLDDKKYLLINQSIPSSASESLWIQQGLHQLNTSGKMIIQMAMGWLFRSGYDGKLRDYLIEKRLISGLIFLPESLSPGTMIGTVLIILDKEQSKSVKFIDARNLGKLDKSKGFKTLSKAEITKIVDAFRNGTDDPDFYKDISFQQIRDNEYNLSANKYFYQEIEITKLNLSTEVEKLNQLESQFIESSKNFNALVKKLIN